MTSRELFEPTTEKGWRMGFSALMRKELKAWFGTSVWWQQSLLWTLILGLFGSAGISDPEAGIIIFYFMATIFPSIATIIISHEVILEEKRSGSAEWVLSKPVSREAFLLPKFIGLGIAFSFSMILVPGLVAYLIFYLFGVAPDFYLFLMSLGPLALWQMFLAYLTLCMGTFFDDAGPVMAVPFPFLFVGINLGQHPLIGEYGPWGLFQVSISLVTGGSFPFTPVFITVAVLFALIVLAIWRFRKHEF